MPPAECRTPLGRSGAPRGVLHQGLAGRGPVDRLPGVTGLAGRGVGAGLQPFPYVVAVEPDESGEHLIQSALLLRGHVEVDDPGRAVLRDVGDLLVREHGAHHDGHAAVPPQTEHCGDGGHRVIGDEQAAGAGRHLGGAQRARVATGGVEEPLVRDLTHVGVEVADAVAAPLGYVARDQSPDEVHQVHVLVGGGVRPRRRFREGGTSGQLRLLPEHRHRLRHRARRGGFLGGQGYAELALDPGGDPDFLQGVGAEVLVEQGVGLDLGGLHFENRRDYVTQPVAYRLVRHFIAHQQRSFSNIDRRHGANPSTRTSRGRQPCGSAEPYTIPSNCFRPPVAERRDLLSPVKSGQGNGLYGRSSRTARVFA